MLVGASESGATGIAEAGMAANPNSAIADVRSIFRMSFSSRIRWLLVIARRLNVRLTGRFKCYGTLTVQYRIQFLDRSTNIIREWSANARDVAGGIKLIVDTDWPPRAVTMRVLDAYARERCSSDA